MIGIETRAVLEAQALDAWNRALDVEKTLWGSIPLLVSGMAVIGAVLGASIAAIKAGTAWWLILIAGCAVASYALAVMWLWVLLRPRVFLRMPSDTVFGEQAAELHSIHAGHGLKGTDLDQAVAADLRQLVREAHAEAAEQAVRNNTVRLHARSQLILCLFIAFVLIELYAALNALHQLEQGTAHGSPITVQSPATPGNAQPGSFDQRAAPAPPPAPAARSG